ncbi:MAG: SulP family inorganic anion transporter [Bosea sp.]|uniref:SulP family inorganic anion transporter n=1 Tax=Bosea sp. (in: a-proteobacteria) TaxID=1871050 RepID=UPI001AC2B3A0|nr:SulP family inorganic anion transporter [Bosea sp. (in: a-proteobacteria)]MBN9454350.1 SulP family inorganic anion transporter [Bosea sp. (in: a-proteobacteria)]
MSNGGALAGPERSPKNLSRLASLGRDLLAGLTLAAITVPEQMATARLGGFPVQVGLFAFVAATIGFLLLGASRVLTVGADTTITPIFAGALTTLAVGGVVAPAAAPTLAILVGALLLLAGFLRFGWIADFLSTPVVTGFLAGIAAHIVVSQLPGLLGLHVETSSLVPRLAEIWAERASSHPVSVLLGLGVLGVIILCEKSAAALPGALIAFALATAAVMAFNLESHGVAVLGSLPKSLPPWPGFALAWADLRALLPLALIVALVVMMQTATVSRSFRDPDDHASDAGRDYLGLAGANLLAGLAGAFPVNASPPRTAIVVESGGRNPVVGLVAAALVLGLALFGTDLLADVPEAAFAGVLFFVAGRILRIGLILQIARQSRPEFALVLLTALAVTLLPIESGVAIGIGLSLLHGIWMTTRSQLVEFGRIPGTTVWWPPEQGKPLAILPGILVVGFPAPLLFANALGFQQELLDRLVQRKPHLLVLEASGIAAIDYTAAQTLLAVAEACEAQGTVFAIARVESARARAALDRFGVVGAIGGERIFHSVDQAVIRWGGETAAEATMADDVAGSSQPPS